MTIGVKDIGVCVILIVIIKSYCTVTKTEKVCSFYVKFPVREESENKKSRIK
jgi:hypothetical protein